MLLFLFECIIRVLIRYLKNCGIEAGSNQKNSAINEFLSLEVRLVKIRHEKQNVEHVLILLHGFLNLSYIYLGSSVCLSSCHIPVILSYLRNAELFFMF